VTRSYYYWHRSSREKVTAESDQTSLMINKKKHIGKSKYKVLRAEEKNLKTFFSKKTTTTTTKSKKRQLPQDLQSVGRLFQYFCQTGIVK